MNGNTIGQFIDDLLLMGGPEKEFVFRNKFYFLETTTLPSQKEPQLRLTIDEYDNGNPGQKRFLHSYCFDGSNFTECVSKMEEAAIFEGLTIYQAEQEITVLFG